MKERARTELVEDELPQDDQVPEQELVKDQAQKNRKAG